MRRFLLLVPVVALLIAGGVGLFRVRTSESVGGPAPQFELPGLHGGSFGLGDLRGRPAVLNFWASWCEPCADEAPELAAAAGEWSARVRFLGMNILDGRDEAREFERRYAIPYDSARDARGTISKRFGVTGAPETFFLDARGRIVGRYIGAFETGQLGPLLRRLTELGAGETLSITGRGRTRPVP